MAILESEIDSTGETFNRNAQVMGDAVQEFRDIERKVIDTAAAKVPRYRAKGLIPPRERLAMLLDAGSPFMELSTLCGYMQEGDMDGSSAGGSCITGIGYVQNARCIVLIDDYLTKGGSITMLGAAKRRRMMQLALANKMPVITLAQSGGGNLAQLGDFLAAPGLVLLINVVCLPPVFHKLP
jgi:geranyl-CoA carboxylase beta subunit